MSSTARAISGGVLTFFLLGFSYYIQRGSFIVPFPFIAEFVFLMVLAIVLYTLKPWTRINTFLISFAVFGVLSGRFLWELVLDFETLVYLFEETILVDVFNLIKYLSVGLIIFEVYLSLKIKAFKWLHLVALAALVATLYVNNNNILMYWFCAYGLLSFITLRVESQESLKTAHAQELFVGLGLINLMSIVSLVIN